MPYPRTTGCFVLARSGRREDHLSVRLPPGHNDQYDRHWAAAELGYEELALPPMIFAFPTAFLGVDGTGAKEYSVLFVLTVRMFVHSAGYMIGDNASISTHDCIAQACQARLAVVQLLRMI